MTRASDKSSGEGGDCLFSVIQAGSEKLPSKVPWLAGLGQVVLWGCAGTSEAPRAHRVLTSLGLLPRWRGVAMNLGGCSWPLPALVRAPGVHFLLGCGGQTPC